MGKYELSNKDFDQIKTVIKIAESIEDIYKKLYVNEINNKEIDINKLVLACSLEKNKYEEFNLTMDRIIAWYDYLLCKLPKNFVNNYEELMTLNYDNRVIIRVISNVVDIMYYNKVREYVSEIKEKIENIGYKLNKYGENFIRIYLCNEDMLNDALNIDILKSYLYFLQNCIEDPKYEDIKDYLIAAKYNMSFTKKEIEKSLISTNFQISKDLYLNAKFVSDLLNFDDNYYNRHKNLYGQGIAFNNALNLLDITDKKFNDKEGKVCAILRKCMINAAFLLMSDKNIENLNYNISMHVKNYNMYYMNSKNSKYILSEVFDEARKNRDIPKVISLVKNNK